MAWATFQQGNKYCVFALDADNNKKGESLECYPSREQAQTYVKGLYAKENKAKSFDDLLAEWKAGRRNAGVDQTRVQKIHDLTCELDAQCKEQDRGLGPFDATDKLAIFKDAQTGKYRWVSFSSSAFRDRDREIVSTKALTDDVSRADADNDYGPLRFWHEPGIDIGYTDFNAMEGRVLVESGGFNDEAVGAALKNHQDELGLSIGFTHPATEPDASGTYHNIRRFERSIVPADKASNLLTQFIVKSTGDVMDATKKTLLEKLIGPDLAAKFIGNAQETQKQAEDAGMKFKVETEVKAEDKPAEDEEKKPAELFTASDAKEMINKAFAEYEAKQAESKKAADEVTTKATSDVLAALKSIQDGQTAITATNAELKEAVTLALTGVAELNGALPRRLGEQFKGFTPSGDGKTVTDTSLDAVKQAAAMLKASQADLQNAQGGVGAFPNDPFAKFTSAILGGANSPSPYVVPGQPQGS